MSRAWSGLGLYSVAECSGCSRGEGCCLIWDVDVLVFVPVLELLWVGGVGVCHYVCMVFLFGFCVSR